MPILISQSVTAFCLFGAAGRLSWWRGWLLIGLSLVTGLAASAVTWRDAAMAAERRNARAGKDWDKAIVAFVVFLGPVVTWLTAGLDVRYSWSSGVPAGAFAAGVVAAACGGALLVWAMRTNTFFSAVVRIQKERGHTVVTGGPYRLVRHPGYCGMSLFLLATPLVLNSRWAFIPALVTIAVNVLRTVLEDRVLHQELEGYADYARRVRYRLVPFVW